MKLADASPSQLKMLDDLMQEMKEMWQRIRDLEAAKKASQDTIDAQKTAISRYRVAFKHLPCGVYVKDAAMKYLFCNDTYARTFGLRPDEIQGKSDGEILPQEVAFHIGSGERQAKEADAPSESEIRYFAGGISKTYLAVRRPVRAENGDASGLLGILFDVTDAKARERERESVIVERTVQIENLGRDLQEARQKGEESRLRAEDLEARLRQRDGEIEALRKEVETLSAGRAAAADALLKSIQGFQGMAEEFRSIARLLSPRQDS